MLNQDLHPQPVGTSHVPLISTEEFIRMELEEIRRFQREHNLSENEAALTWINQFSMEWRTRWEPYIIPKKELVSRAREEMARHRWIESEKRGIDLGIHAEMDWIKHHLRAFKNYWLQMKEGATI
ncbi:MAG: hypothetical protein RBU29_11840 [bacterium]|jgi:hypothetical protein|nr:hypothetical protein [bacterium]